MSTARRAAIEAPEVTVSTASPRRVRAEGVGPALRRGLAPAAIVGLLAVTTTLTFVPMGPGNTTSVADPLTAYDARVANRASREFARVPAPVISASPTSPAAALPSISPSASPTVAAPSASPTVAASVAAPAPAAAPVAVKAVVVTPEVDWSVKGKDAGARWISDSVNVRTGPGTGHDVVTTLAEGRKVTITNSEHDGWRQISLKSGAGWVKNSFLSDEEPAATTQASSTSSSSSSTSSAKKSSGAVSAAGSCPRAGSAENGMKSSTVSVLRKVCAAFPSITSYGGYRAGSSGYHGSGHAIDAMISGDTGWEVARWVRANASSLGVVEVIYQQKIWTTQRSGDGWRSMSDRGSATANHYDHVHISVG